MFRNLNYRIKNQKIILITLKILSAFFMFTKYASLLYHFLGHQYPSLID